jgi:hypothetical protein
LKPLPLTEKALNRAGVPSGVQFAPASVDRNTAAAINLKRLAARRSCALARWMACRSLMQA